MVNTADFQINFAEAAGVFCWAIQQLLNVLPLGVGDSQAILRCSNMGEDSLLPHCDQEAGKRSRGLLQHLPCAGVYQEL